MGPRDQTNFEATVPQPLAGVSLIFGPSVNGLKLELTISIQKRAVLRFESDVSVLIIYVKVIRL